MSNDEGPKGKLHLVGGGEPGPEGEQLSDAERHQLHLAQAGADIYAVLQRFAPAFAPWADPASFAPLAAKLATEQIDLINAQILPTMLEPGSDYPVFGIKVTGRSGVAGVAAAPKRLEDCGDDPGQAIAQALALAFLLTPVVRGLLQLAGFKYDFEQKRSKPKLLI